MGGARLYHQALRLDRLRAACARRRSRFHAAPRRAWPSRISRAPAIVRRAAGARPPPRAGLPAARGVGRVHAGRGDRPRARANPQAGACGVGVAVRPLHRQRPRRAQDAPAARLRAARHLAQLAPHAVALPPRQVLCAAARKLQPHPAPIPLPPHSHHLAIACHRGQEAGPDLQSEAHRGLHLISRRLQLLRVGAPQLLTTHRSPTSDPYPNANLNPDSNPDSNPDPRLGRCSSSSTTCRRCPRRPCCRGSTR